MDPLADRIARRFASQSKVAVRASALVPMENLDGSLVIEAIRDAVAKLGEEMTGGILHLSPKDGLTIPFKFSGGLAGQLGTAVQYQGLLQITPRRAPFGTIVFDTFVEVISTTRKVL